MGNKEAKQKSGKGKEKGAAEHSQPPAGKHTEWPGVPSRVSSGTSDGNNHSHPSSNAGSGAPRAQKQQLQLTENDYTFLTGQTGMSKEAIKQIFDQFNENNPEHNGQLNKREFINLYTKLRPEAADQLDEISQFVFRAFDADRNGTIDFSEFMIAYSLTSRGDVRKKLEYAFAIYDADNNGYLDRNELREVITGMLDLLGADKQSNDVGKLTEECIRGLDVSNDGRISKSNKN